MKRKPVIRAVHVHSSTEPPEVIGWCLCKTNSKRALYSGKSRKWSEIVPLDYFATEQEALSKIPT